MKILMLAYLSTKISCPWWTNLKPAAFQPRFCETVLVLNQVVTEKEDEVRRTLVDLEPASQARLTEVVGLRRRERKISWETRIQIER